VKADGLQLAVCLSILWVDASTFLVVFLGLFVINQVEIIDVSDYLVVLVVLSNKLATSFITLYRLGQVSFSKVYFCLELYNFQKIRIFL